MLYSQKVQIPNSYSQPYMLRLCKSGTFLRVPRYFAK